MNVKDLDCSEHSDEREERSYRGPVQLKYEIFENINQMKKKILQITEVQQQRFTQNKLLIYMSGLMESKVMTKQNLALNFLLDLCVLRIPHPHCSSKSQQLLVTGSKRSGKVRSTFTDPGHWAMHHV